ncbi:MAG TPA: DUF2125 domain-containing protein [Acidiphilium sp.]
MRRDQPYGRPSIARRGSRTAARSLIVLIIVLIVAYLAAWWYAEGRLEAAFRQQEAAFRKAGWTVTHGATARGTSPLLARFSVADLTLTPPDRGMPSPSIAFPNVDLDVHPGSPFTLDVGLPLAWTVAIPAGPTFTIRFATLRSSYRFDPNALFHDAPDPLRTADVSFTDMRVDSGGTNFTLVSIKALTVHGSRDPAAGKTATALSIHENIEGLALSPIFVTLGNLPFDGKLASLAFDLNLSGPQIPAFSEFGQPLTAPRPNDEAADPLQSLQTLWQALGPQVHDWAKAGGHGTYKIALALGPLDAHDSGDFGFDPQTQPVGHSTLTADGLDRFFGDLGTVYPDAVGMISTIAAETAPYMTKGPKGGQRFKAGFALAGGVLTANGKKVANVPKLDWPRPVPAMTHQTH